MNTNVLLRTRRVRRAVFRGPGIGEERPQAGPESIIAQVPAFKRVARMEPELEQFDGEAQHYNARDGVAADWPTDGDERGQEPEQSKRHKVQHGVWCKIPHSVNMHMPAEEVAIGDAKICLRTLKRAGYEIGPHNKGIARGCSWDYRMAM